LTFRSPAQRISQFALQTPVQWFSCRSW
jgi:hypothetical protein